MGRYIKFSNAYAGIINLIANSPIKTNPSNLNVEYKIINKYCRENKIKGSFSERVLLINENFQPFRDYVKNYEATTIKP